VLCSKRICPGANFQRFANFREKTKEKRRARSPSICFKLNFERKKKFILLKFFLFFNIYLHLLRFLLEILL